MATWPNFREPGVKGAPPHFGYRDRTRCVQADHRKQGRSPRSWPDNNAAHIIGLTERLPGVRGRWGSFSYLQSVLMCSARYICGPGLWTGRPKIRKIKSA